MKSVLIIQGEGRGHISQAISFCQRESIDVKKIFISNQRYIPESFLSEFNGVPIEKLDSLNFEYKKGKISILKTITKNIIKIPQFIKNLIYIRGELNIIKPEQVINFYEPLSLATIFKYKKISISNQYLFSHDKWEVPNKSMNLYVLKFWNKLTSIGSELLISPSFINLNDTKKIKIIEPLIKSSLLNKETKIGDYILVYIIDKDLVKKFTNNINSTEKYILFCDKSFTENLYLPDNVIYQELSPKKFDEYLLNCKEVIATGGFQLISECVYLNKKITVIPLHYEQKINAYNLKINNLGDILIL